jgi:hypothetical protein
MVLLVQELLVARVVLVAVVVVRLAAQAAMEYFTFSTKEQL